MRAFYINNFCYMEENENKLPWIFSIQEKVQKSSFWTNLVIYLALWYLFVWFFYLWVYSFTKYSSYKLYDSFLAVFILASMFSIIIWYLLVWYTALIYYVFLKLAKSPEEIGLMRIFRASRVLAFFNAIIVPVIVFIQLILLEMRDIWFPAVFSFFFLLFCVLQLAQIICFYKSAVVLYKAKSYYAEVIFLALPIIFGMILFFNILRIFTK